MKEQLPLGMIRRFDRKVCYTCDSSGLWAGERLPASLLVFQFLASRWAPPFRHPGDSRAWRRVKVVGLKIQRRMRGIRVGW
jgi:hypothetical protein